MKKLTRSLSLILSVSLFISSAFPPVPAFALRVLQDEEGSQSVRRAGMEEVTLQPMEDSVVRDNHDRLRLRSILRKIPTLNGKVPRLDQLSPGRRDPRFSFVARQQLPDSNGNGNPGPVVGLVVGTLSQDFPGAVYVSWFGTHRDKRANWRRKGIGQKLMEEVFRAAEAAGYSKVTWHTAQDNLQAQRFYGSLNGVYVAEKIPASLKEKAGLRYEADLRLRSRDPEIRKAAVWEIEKTDFTPAAGALIRLAMDDPQPDIREEAEDTLIEMAPRSIPALTSALADSDQEIRWAAVHILGAMGVAATDAVSELQQLLQDKDWSIRFSAAAVLSDIETRKSPKSRTASPIRWAGDLPPVTQVIEGQPRPAEVSLHLWAPTVPDKKFLDLLELKLVVEGEPKPLPVEKDLIRLDPEKHGPGKENFKVWVTLPKQVQGLLAQRGHLRYRFQYRLNRDPDWQETTRIRHPHNPSGELSYHPDWLFRWGMTTINAKAWGSFEAILRRLPKLEEAGAKVIVLQGIHPGHSAFEIDDYEIADPKLGGDEALDRLLQEGKKRGFRFIIPFVPGHTSDRNPWIAEDPRLFYQVKEQGEFPEMKTILVNIHDRPVRFLRGNVFPGNKDLPEGDVHSAEIKEGFGPTVAFNLWSKIARDRLAPRWEEILGKWARRGISGFYTDTTHSIDQVLASVGDPDWLDGIKRRVRAKNPGVIFGDEALWGKDGPFINERGAYFAQPYWPYIELLLDFMQGNKQPIDLAKKLAEVEEKAPGMLRQIVIFLQNHDENVKPVAFHVEQDKRGQKEEFLGVLAVLQILGLPGIPSLEIGQINGDSEKWLVTGHLEEYDRKWNYGYHQDAPPPPLYDPFANQNERAQRLRGLHSRLFHLRADNPAFWLPEQIRYPTASAHVFASYRSAGNRRAVVVLSANRGVSESRVDIAVELDKLNLPEEELKALAEALKEPGLVWPTPANAEPLQGKVEQNLLMLKMPPTGAVVLEFEVAAAGMEQPVFPAPVQTDRPAAWVIWRDGGNLYPSGNDPLGAVAFVSPEDGKAGMGIYASLWNLNSEDMLAEVFRLPGILPDRPVHLYDSGRVPPETRQEVERILRDRILPKKSSKESGWEKKGLEVGEEKGLEVVVRLSGTRGGKDWIVPMVPIDAGAGQIRFEGWMPARPEFVGDYTVTVEVRWGARWHRLKETGRFRIHPLNSNGHKLRIPEGQKHKLAVSPTGQPVVIGWDPRWNLRKAASSWQVPVADQPYWIRFWDGRFYLLNREQMERFGFSHDPDRPDLWPGQLIVEAAVNVDSSGGMVVIPSGEVFDDKDKTLGARLEKAFEVLGVRWPLEGFQPLPQPQADERHISLQTMFEQLNKIGDSGSLRDFLGPWGERGWERMSGVLRQAPYEERDRFLHLLHQRFAQWEGNDPKAPVFRVSNAPIPRSFHPNGPPMVALILNGVLDLIWRNRGDLPGRPIEQTLLPGGGPLAVARAAANLREGGEVDITVLGSGEAGERLFVGLQQAGFREESQDGQTALLIPVKGEETRISVNGVVSSSPTVPTDYIRKTVDAVARKMADYGPRKGTLVIGEHLVRVSDSEDPQWVAKELASLTKAAKEMGWKIAVAASSSWDAKTFNEILETRPDTFHLDLEPFARLVSSQQKKYTEEDLLYLPKQDLAQMVDRIRGLYGVERLIVSLGAAGEILVTPAGWFAAVPSPDLELTYVTGERDLVLGVFTRLLQMGAPEKEALHQAVVAGVLHMEGWGRPVTQKEIEENRHRAQVVELLQPARSRAAFVGPAETPAFPEASMVPLKLEQKPGKLRTFRVEGGKADHFAKAAERDIRVRVVIGPTAFKVEGLSTALELLAATSLRERFEVLPSQQVPYVERLMRMKDITRRFREIPDLSVIGYADTHDLVMEEFGELSGQFHFQKRGLASLAVLVRELLLNFGVPEGTATEEAVAEFLSAAGVEQNA